MACEVGEHRHRPDPVLQFSERAFEVVNAIQTRRRQRLQNTLAGDLIEVDARQPCNDTGRLGLDQLLPDRLLVETVVAEQSDRDKEVILVVADEINDPQVILAETLAQATTELLGKDDAGLSVAQHHDLVHLGNIDSLIEDIAGEDVVQFPGCQILHGVLALLTAGVTSKSDRPQPSAIELTLVKQGS